jgi:hypothetical protein
LKSPKLIASNLLDALPGEISDLLIELPDIDDLTLIYLLNPG